MMASTSTAALSGSDAMPTAARASVPRSQREAPRETQAPEGARSGCRTKGVEAYQEFRALVDGLVGRLQLAVPERQLPRGEQQVAAPDEGHVVGGRRRGSGQGHAEIA